MNELRRQFLGNEALKQTLIGTLSEGRLLHAVLIEGESGCGKKTLARLLAAGILCTGQGEAPCGECPACRKILEDKHPDVEWYGGQGSRSFHIDTIRAIKASAYVAPNEAAGRVMILTDVQNMTVQAQNALLKVFEEPPENVTFLLTCDNVGKLLPTIASRATVYRVENPSYQEGLEFLKGKMPHKTEEELSVFMRAFGGNLGWCQRGDSEDFVTLFWSCIGFLKRVGKGDEFGMLKQSAAWCEKGPVLLEALQILRYLCRNLFLAGSNAGVLCTPDLQETQEELDGAGILSMISFLEKAQSLALQNVSAALCVCQLCADIKLRQLS